MSEKEFQLILTKSNNLAVFLSGIIALFGGVLIFHGINSIGEKELISISISLLFGLIILVMGIIALKRLLNDQIKAKKGTHPLLKALKERDKDFLVWVYIEQINTTLEKDGPVLGTAQNINYFTRDCKGKGKVIMTGKKHSAQEVIDFLTTKFDIPYLDYSDETRQAMNKYFKTNSFNQL